MTKPLREYMNEYIEEKHKNDEDRTIHIHVTDLSRCLNAVYWEKKGMKKDDSNESRERRFEVGHIIEKNVLEALEHAGAVVSTHGKMEWPELNMVGSYDILIKNSEGEVELVEVKSIHPFAIDKVLEEGKPHAHYVEQVQLYLSKLREVYPNIRGRIFYFALDGRTLEYDIVFDKAIVELALAKAATLKVALETDTPPTPEEAIISEDGKWVLNWRVQYAITDGLRKYAETPLAETAEQWISKLRYMVKKKNTV